MARADDFRRQVNELWQQAVDQLEEVKDTITESRSWLEKDLLRLRKERDKLLKRLGEQTYKLANQDKLPMPAVVKRTVDRLNKVIDSLIAKEKRSKGKQSAKKSKSKTKKKTKKSKKKSKKKASRKSA